MSMMADQMDYFFNPRGVAVIGASANPAKLSHGVVRNLKGHGYQGAIYPINPKGGQILGLPVFHDIAAVPDPIELAIIMVRAPHAPQALEACGKRGLKAAIVVTGGFREAGDEGADLEQSLKTIAAKYEMRIIGPNCVGIMDTHVPIDTTFIAKMPQPGPIGFASHSGAIVGGTIDWAISMGVGYSRILSLGNQVDVSLADGTRMLAQDPHTTVINLYAEGIPNGPGFVQTAASITPHKPIILVKAGRTAAGTRAVASHTGALAGADRAYQAACHRAGILMVTSLQEQNDVAMALAHQPLPQGPRVAIITNAGGPAALASDTLDERGLQLANLTEETLAGLKAVTPHDTQLNNPVDMLGGPSAEMYADTIRILQQDPGVDMILAIFVPQAITPVNDVAQHIVQAAQGSAKPVATCLVGGASIPDAIHILHKGAVPFYQDPNRAARALAGLWEYRQIKARPTLHPTPLESADHTTAKAALQRSWTQAATFKKETQHFLDADTAAQVAAAYGIQIPFSGLADTAETAVALAEQSGYPVAAKLIAPGIVHKADVGGILLNLSCAADIHEAFNRLTQAVPDAHVMIQQMAPKGQEVILGAQRDPQFGPLLMFGMGGIYVEVLRDVAFRLAPIAASDAREMILETAAGKIMQGVRGEAPGDIEAVVDTLCRVGQLVAAFPCISELDINPLIVGAEGQGAWAVDVRIAIDKEPD